jgi:hypothetical protein
MKPKNLILLSLLLVVCLGYVVVKHIRNSQTTAPVTGSLFGQTIEGFSYISIEPPDAEAMVFERVGDEWYIRSPLDCQADDVSMLQLENALASLTLQRALPPEQAASEPTGLGTPTWKVRATTLDGTPIMFDVGATVPQIGTGQIETYIRHYPDGRESDARICVVPRNFDALFTRPPAAFRHRRLLDDINPSTVYSIAITGPHAWTLTRTPNGWSVQTTTFTAPAIDGIVSPLLVLLQDFYVQDFTETDDLADLGLTDDTAQLLLHLTEKTPDGESRTRTLTLGNPTHSQFQLYASLTGHDEVLLIGSELLDQLQVTPEALRDPRVLQFDPDAVIGVQLDLPDGTIDLVRDGGRWHMVEPLAALAEDRAVNDLLTHLAGMNARDFHDLDDPATLGLAEPRGTITLMLTGADDLITLDMGTIAPDGAVFVQSSQHDTVYSISPATYQPLLDSPGTFYDHTLLNVPIHNVARLVLHRPDGTTFTVNRRDDGSWEMLAPTTGEAEASVVETILSGISPLRADTIVSWAPEIPYRYLDRSSTIMLTVTTETLSADSSVQDPMATQTHALRVVRPGGSGNPAYAWRPGYKPVIVGQIDPAIYDALMTPIASRRLWDVPADTITEITLTEGLEAPFTLQKLEGRWTVPTDPYARVDSAAADKFVQAIRRAKASRYLNDTTEHPDRFGLTAPWITIGITTADGTARTLTISSAGPGDATLERYAMATGTDVIVLVSSESLRDLAKGSDDFVKP